MAYTVKPANEGACLFSGADNPLVHLRPVTAEGRAGWDEFLVLLGVALQALDHPCCVVHFRIKTEGCVYRAALDGFYYGGKGKALSGGPQVALRMRPAEAVALCRQLRETLPDCEPTIEFYADPPREENQE